MKTLGLSHRDIDFIQGLRWSLEEVSRTYGVPKLLLGDFERATYANVQASERMFWRNTVVPEVKFLEEQLNRMLLPRLGYPQLTVEFDLSAIEALQEDENNRGAAGVGAAGSRRADHQRGAPGAEPARGAVGRWADRRRVGTNDRSPRESKTPHLQRRPRIISGCIFTRVV